MVTKKLQFYIALEDLYWGDNTEKLSNKEIVMRAEEDAKKTMKPGIYRYRGLTIFAKKVNRSVILLLQGAQRMKILMHLHLLKIGSDGYLYKRSGGIYAYS